MTMQCNFCVCCQTKLCSHITKKHRLEYGLSIPKKNLELSSVSYCLMWEDVAMSNKC